MGKKPESAGELIARALPASYGSRTLAEIKLRWISAVGSELAVVAKPTAIIGGELVISAPNPSVAHELRFREAEIREALYPYLAAEIKLKLKITAQ